MKKLLFILTALTIVSIVTLAAIKSHSFNKRTESAGSCPAPTNLSIQKQSSAGGTFLVCSWTSTGAVQWTYSLGYATSQYSWQGVTNTTYTYPVSVPVPAGTIMATLQVTATCQDGSKSTSTQLFKHF